ncbi:MAG: hypothetical protein R3C28_10040 [Pirellulaceae bacterium]
MAVNPIVETAGSGTSTHSPNRSFDENGTYKQATTKPTLNVKIDIHISYGVWKLVQKFFENLSIVGEL